MTQRIRATAILATLLVGTIAAPAAADTSEDESVLEAVAADAEGALETVSALADGLAGVAKGYAARAAAYDPFGEPERWSAARSASAVATEVESNATVYEGWLSERLTASTERDVLAVAIENRTASATVYLVADVRNGSYHNLTATRSTSRTVDERCTLSGRAGRNASDELATFRERFAVPNENLIAGYLGRVGAEYKGAIDCSFINP